MSDRPLRVAILIDELQRAGAQLHAVQLACHLDRARFAPRVICLLEGGPAAEPLLESGIPVEVLGLGRLYGPSGLAGLPGLARRLRAEGVDLLHTYLVSANIYGTLAGRMAGTPAIVTTRRDTGFSRNWRLRLFEEWLINPRVDRVVAVSRAVAECARRERGLDDARIVTIQNGVDLSTWDPARYRDEVTRRRGELEPGERTVGVVASLVPVKGHADLLRAAARVTSEVPRARFVLIGDGPLRPALETMARSLGIAERVSFTGARGDVASLLAMLDLVVVPSHTEGMSNALLEAMAMARPVVATAVGGNAELVREGVTGLLVPPRRPEALAAAVVRLLKDAGEARAMGREARRRVSREFGLERMVTRHEALYEELVAGSAR